MKTLIRILSILASLSALSLFAAANKEAPAAYPLKTCIVSGEALGGDMGAPVDYLYKQTGKPDRLVRFCCKSCIKSFEKEPAKYLKKLDEAAAGAKAKADPHAGHQH